MTTTPNGAVLRGIGASITDAAGNVWTIAPDSRITVNGTVDATTAGVDELAYYNGLVWQKNTANHWYSKTSPSSAWTAWTAAAPPVPIQGVSANDARINAGSAAKLTNSNGNIWGLVNSASGYKVTTDGATDLTTVNVAQMALVNGVVWQENTAGLWYSKTTPASAWSAPTTTNPITGTTAPISLTWLGGGNNLASNPADWSPAVAPKPGYTLTMSAGTMNLTGNALAGDTLTVPTSGIANISTTGAASLNLSLAASNATANIHVAAGSTLTLNAHVTRGFLNASGGTIQFIGSNSFSAFKTVLADNLTGTATLSLTGGNASGELMELGGSVSQGLTFSLSGSAPDASLQIDNPGSFKGLINLTNAPVGVGHVEFMGLHATSGELLNGILQMFNGTTLVDTARVSGGVGLQLHQSTTGVILTAGAFSDLPPSSLGTLIPLQT